MGRRAIVLTAGRAVDAAVGGYALRVVPANGGGVDRYVRDICAHRMDDCTLHPVTEQCVFETVPARRFIPVTRKRMTDSSVVHAFGRPSLLHAHSTLAPVRERVARLSNALGVDYLATLHDVDFAGAFGVVGDDERRACLDFVSHAAERVVPSEFISDVLSAARGSQTSRQRIENGVPRTATHSEPAAVRGVAGAFPIAVVGPLGPPKGLKFLQSVVAVLPSEIRVVIIGYAGGQITSGWLQPDRLWVHGAFQSCDLPTLIQGYGVRLALLPNGQPESYRYALSDAWSARLPALGPPAGAIGERIARCGAGWTYPVDSSAEVVATMALDCLTTTGRVAANVQDSAAALLTMGDMVGRLNQCYEKIMRTAQTHQSAAELTPQLAALETVAAIHLNGHFFRGELIRLGGDLAPEQAQAAYAEKAFQTVTHKHDERGRWIATLETSLEESKAEIARIEAARLVVRDEQREWIATLQATVADSKALIARVEAMRIADLGHAQSARIRERAQLEEARAHERALEKAASATELVLQRTQTEAARAEVHAAHERLAAKLQQDVTDTLTIAHQRQHTVAIHERTLSVISTLTRRRTLVRTGRLMFTKAAQ